MDGMGDTTFMGNIAKNLLKLKNTEIHKAG